jgi:hypothetical protein
MRDPKCYFGVVIEPLQSSLELCQSWFHMDECRMFGFSKGDLPPILYFIDVPHKRKRHPLLKVKLYNSVLQCSFALYT